MSNLLVISIGGQRDIGQYRSLTKNRLKKSLNKIRFLSLFGLKIKISRSKFWDTDIHISAHLKRRK